MRKFFSRHRAILRSPWTWAVFAFFQCAAAFAQSMSDMPTLSGLQAQGSGTAGGEAVKIFGSLLDPDFVANPLVAVGKSSGLLGQIFFQFNASLFVIGAGYIMYFGIVAVTESANTGEVLGKSMSGTWIPIRLGTGIFGMMPAFHGFSLAQAVMFSIALLGNGLGNQIAQTAVSANAQFNVLVPAPGLTTSNSPLVIDEHMGQSLFAMNVCALAANDHEANLAGNSGTFVEPIEDDSGISVVGSTVDCGGVEVVDESGNVRGTSFTESFGYRNPGVNYDAIASTAKIISANRKKYLFQLQEKMNTRAKAWYAAFVSQGSVPSYPADDVAQDVQTVSSAENADTQNQIQQLAQTESAVSSTALSGMNAEGWMSLGSWYAVFAETNAAIQSASASSHFIVKPIDIPSLNASTTLLSALATIGVQQRAAKDTCLKVFDKNPVGSCAPMQNLFMHMVNGLVGDTGGQGMVNPIIAAKNIGDWLLVGVGSVMTTYAISRSGIIDHIPVVGTMIAGVQKVASAVSSFAPTQFLSGLFAPFSGGDSDGNSYAAKLGGVVITSALVLGLMLSVYVPSIPFLTWFNSCINYYVSVIEGLIAAQVWGFSHLSAQGEGMGSKSEKGYIYALNMLLRPALMILGFFFSAAILNLMFTFFFSQYATQLANVQGNTTTGPFIMMGHLALITIVLISVVQTVFNMCYEVPDRVIAWFGHGMESRMASNLDHAIEGKMDKASNWTGSAVMNSTSQR